MKDQEEIVVIWLYHTQYLLLDVPNMGSWQAANLSREVIWGVHGLPSDSQWRVSNYQDHSPIFSSTGCDLGPQLDLFNMIIPFWFQASTLFSLSHTRSWNLFVSGTLGGRGGFSFCPEQRQGSSLPHPTRLPSVSLEACLSPSPGWAPRRGCVCLCHRHQSFSQTAGYILAWRLLLIAWWVAQKDHQVGHACTHYTPHLTQSLRWPPDFRARQRPGQLSSSSGGPCGCTCHPRKNIGTCLHFYLSLSATRSGLHVGMNRELSLHNSGWEEPCSPSLSNTLHELLMQTAFTTSFCYARPCCLSCQEEG